MPLNLKNYETNPILTGGDLFDLIFQETMDELTSRNNGTTDTKYQGRNIPDMVTMHAIHQEFHNWFSGNLVAGVFSRVDNFNLQGEAGFYRDEVFTHLKSFDILKYYEGHGMIIPEEVYALVEKYAVKETTPATTSEPAQTETEAKLKKKRNDKFTRSDPDEKIRAAIKKLKGKDVPQHIAPYRPEILFAAKEKDGLIDRKKDYKKQVGIALSTVQAMARKIYNS